MDLLDELNGALDNDAKFMPIFERLTKDSQVRQIEALEMGRMFVTKMAASTSKKLHLNEFCGGTLEVVQGTATRRCRTFCCLTSMPA